VENEKSSSRCIPKDDATAFVKVLRGVRRASEDLVKGAEPELVSRRLMREGKDLETLLGRYGIKVLQSGFINPRNPKKHP